MSKKILVLGLGQNNFLSYLYSTLKRYNDNYFISAPFFSDLNKTNTDESWMYSNENIKTKTSFISKIISFFSCVFSKHFFQIFFFILFVEGKLKKAFHFFYKQIQAKSYFLENKNFKEYDIFHFHYMQYSYLRELFLVPKNKKIVCSFWGSDLLRTNDILNFYIVKKALNKTTIITCQSAELREIILSKFGRNLYDKIQINMFPVDHSTYDEMIINTNNKQKISDFKTEFGYSLTKFNILIGHNASSFNNHLKIINAIANLKDKSKIHFILNFNYGIAENEKEKYKSEIIKILEKSGFTYTIIEHFFSKEELALSRLATNVFIHMPISDALSGSMLEMLHASTIVITGSWLPYKTFTNAQLYYHELSDFTLVAEKLNFIFENYETEKEKAIANKILIQNNFLNDSIIKKWDAILS